MQKIKTIPLSEIRNSLPKFRRQVQLGSIIILPTFYGDVVGVFVNLSSAENLSIKTSTQLSIGEFRTNITQCWERLQAELDCFYLTSHLRMVMAFVSPKYISDLRIDLPINILDCGLSVTQP